MRLFVAARPPADVLDAVEAVERPALDGVRWTRRDQRHVTLRFLGEVADPGPVAAALRGADLGGPADALLGPATARLGRDVLMVPVAGLGGLAARVVAATAGLGRAPEREVADFVGHLTLARRRRGGRRLPTGAAVSASWTVEEIEVVASTISTGGADHRVLARIPL